MHRMGANIYLLRNLSLEYFKNLLPNRKKDKGLSLKMARDLNRDLSKEDMLVDRKHVKRCPVSLVIQERHIKPAARYPLTPARMARIRETDNAKCW